MYGPTNSLDLLCLHLLHDLGAVPDVLEDELAESATILGLQTTQAPIQQIVCNVQGRFAKTLATQLLRRLQLRAEASKRFTEGPTEGP